MKLLIKKVQLLITTLLLLTGNFVFAQTIYVDSSVAVSGDGSSWANAYQELRDAVHLIRTNTSITTINIAKGTYKPVTNNNVDTSFYILRGNIKLIGGYASGGGTRDINANPTILEGALQTSAANSLHVVVICGLAAGADSVVFDGLTVRNGNANSIAVKTVNGVTITNVGGAGVYLQSNLNGDKIAFRNCIFQGNTANTGSGVYAKSTGALSFSNCQFNSNIGHGSLSTGTNSYGAGIYSNQSSPSFTNCSFNANKFDRSGVGIGMCNEQSTVTVVNCTISGSFITGAAGGVFGGGIYQLGGTLSVSGSVFSANKISIPFTSQGGAIYGESAVLSLDHCTFDAGNSSPQGSGIYLNNSSNSIISNCFFAKNKNTGLSPKGGGVFNYISSPTITNCVFSRDTLGDGGAGVGLYNAAGSQPIVTNCTFFMNYIAGSGTGGAVYCADSSGGKYRNCIFWKDTAQFISFANRYEFYSANDGTRPTKPRPSIAYSIIMGNLPITNVIDSGSNQTVYPLFVDTTLAGLAGVDGIYGNNDDGLRLQSFSPGIDAGANYSIPAGITTDIAGNARIANSTVDVGAYENTSPTIQLSTTLGINSDSTVKAVNNTLVIMYAGRLITTIQPSGASPVKGGIKTKITIDNSVQQVSGKPYVQRHYDIEPWVNAATATATITLYYTQAEFTAYNAASGSYPLMPIDAADAANNKVNILVHQFHGTPVGGGSSPGNYPTLDEAIVPAAVTWNAGNNWWEVTFNVTGFSGFFLSTVPTPIPVVLEYFTGGSQNNNLAFSWKANCYGSPTSTFILERSSDGSRFNSIYSIQADIYRCQQPFNYTDYSPLEGKAFYRLKMLDINGKTSYSPILYFNRSKPADIYVWPILLKHNEQLQIAVQQKGAAISIFNNNGSLILKKNLVEGVNGIDLEATGLYFYRISNSSGQTEKAGKFIKQ